MRPFRGRFVGLAGALGVAALIAGSGAATAEQAPAFVTLQRPSPFEFLADMDTVRVRIPVTLGTGVKPEELILDIDDVQFGQRRDPALAQAFAAALAGPGAGRGPAIIVSVQLGPAIRAGTYDLLLSVRRGTAPTKQTIPIQLVHPAAQLRPPGTLIVEQFGWTPWTGFNVAAAALPLHESGGRSRLSVTVTQVDNAIVGDRPVSGRLVFDGPVRVPPGLQGWVGYRLQGDFPIGTAKGTLEITASQLANPVAVAFEVRSRLRPILVIPIALLGLLFGYLVRHNLKALVERNETKLKALEVLSRLEAERDHRPDAAFRERLRNPINTLRDPGGAPLTDAVNAATRALDDALKDFGERRALEDKALEDLTRLLDSGYSIPEPMAGRVAHARQRLGGVRERLTGNDVQSAGTEREEIARELGHDLRDDAREWRDGIVAALEALVPVDGAPPAALPPSFSGAIDELRKVLAPLAPVLAAVNPDPQAALEATHRARTAVLDFLEQVLPRPLAPAEEVLRILDAGTPGNRPAVEAFRAALARYRTALPEAQNRPEQLATVTTPLRQALDALATAILAQAEESARNAVAQQIRTGAWLEAARAVAPPAPAAKGDTILGDGDVAAPAMPATRWGEWFARTPDAVFPRAMERVVTIESLPWSTTVERARTARELMGLKWVQIVIAAIGLALASYVLLAEKFVGTPTDFAAVFFAGFVTDLSVDALVESAKSIKRV